MAFVNVRITKEMIDQGIVNHKEGRFFTYDAERNCYLWGGVFGNHAIDLEYLGRFDLVVNGKVFDIKIIPGEGSMTYADSPYIVEWDSIREISPADLHGMKREEVIALLKEALLVYGSDGNNNYTPNYLVKFLHF
jgi:predicted RNase H-like HicB family nuclease